MPNLLSVTGRGPNIMEPIQEALAPVANDSRKAGMILKGPAGAVLADLIFPKPAADGTLDAAVRGGAIGRYERGY